VIELSGGGVLKPYSWKSSMSPRFTTKSGAASAMAVLADSSVWGLP